MADSGALEPHGFIEGDGAAVRLAHFEEYVAFVRGAEFMKKRAGDAFAPVFGMGGQTENLEFIVEGAAPDHVAHHLPIGEFGYFERFVAEGPVDVAEGCLLDFSGFRMIGGNSLPDSGFVDNGARAMALSGSFNNKVL